MSWKGGQVKNKERKLKILPKFFPRSWSGYAVFPEIRLAGKWLQDIGFTCGRFVTITVQDNGITITMLPEAEIMPERESKRKETPVISPEIDALPGDQVFQVWAAEDYYAWVAKRKGNQGRKFTPPEEAQLVTLNPARRADEIDQPADDTQFIPLHPEPSQAADSCNFDTIA
jgi:toxic protein SymE